MIFYNMSNSNSGTFPNFTALEKKDDKVFGKNTMTFCYNIAYMIKLRFFFLFHVIIMTIVYKNYSKFCTRNAKAT